MKTYTNKSKKLGWESHTVRVTFDFGWEGVGCNGNTTASPKKLYKLFKEAYLKQLPLYYQTNGKDSLKLKSMRLHSVSVK